MKHCALLKSVALLALSALLVSCGQTPSKPVVTAQAAVRTPGPESQTEIAEPTQPELEAMREALSQAERAIAAGHPYQALSLVQSIQYAALSSEEQVRGVYLTAQLESIFGSYQATVRAYEALLELNLDILGLTEEDIQERIYKQAVVHQDHRTIVRFGAGLLLNPSETTSLQQSRLMTLATAISKLDVTELNAINREPGKLQQVLLTSIAKASLLNRKDLGAGLCQTWSAAGSLQPLLDGLCSETLPTPNHRTLVALPLSGRLKVAGEAILDGIIFSHLSGASAAELHIVDTEVTDDNDILKQLQSGRFSSMIGPLEKNRVQTWQSLSPLTDASVLALNTPEVAETTGNHFVQLALSPEAEATYLADTVFASGARRILIIRPQTDWGARTLLALRNAWARLEGIEVATATYRDQEDYESSLRVALGVADSAARRRTLGRLSGLSMHLQARRREDIDAVVMLASSPEEARSIKPLLAFHFADDLPVFALSAANDLPDQVDHKDLDGVVTLDIESLTPIPNEAPSSPALARLIALGIDAYELSQLPGLNSPLGSLYRGKTGLLWVDETGFVRRQWKVLQYDKDELKAL